MGLRQRLNEATDELETLRRRHAELEVKQRAQEDELAVAKSDREPWSDLRSLTEC